MLNEVGWPDECVSRTRLLAWITAAELKLPQQQQPHDMLPLGGTEVPRVHLPLLLLCVCVPL